MVESEEKSELGRARREVETLKHQKVALETNLAEVAAVLKTVQGVAAQSAVERAAREVCAPKMTLEENVRCILRLKAAFFARATVQLIVSAAGHGLHGAIEVRDQGKSGVTPAGEGKKGEG